MSFVRLGGTGLEVSRLCVGCMSFGDPSRGNPPSWTLDEQASRALIGQALDAGINFFDTANAYSDGTSEEFLGRALKDATSREKIVVATKVFVPMRPEPNGGGLSRKAIFTEIDNSLRRLQTDYVDLYQIHRFDAHTPIEETLEALHDIVKSGKVRYIGASSMYAWQFAKMLYTAERRGWTRFVSMQDHYNLLYREEEREMHPLCLAEGVGVIPWSPLARGRLTRPWEHNTARSRNDQFGASLYRESDRAIVERVIDLASHRGVPPAQVALAWLLHKSAVTAPIVGATKPEHLLDAIAALDIRLTDDEVMRLEEVYVPHEISGHA